MAENTKKPAIRFAGFTEAWEQRKLGEVAQYRNGKAHENCIDENGKYIVVNSKFISTDGEVKKFSNKKNEALFENEIAFVLSDVPNGRAIARTFWVEKNDKYTLNQRIAGITPIGETFPYFLYILMNRHPYFLAFDDGAKQTNLSVSDVMGFEAYYPKYSEQQKIGAYFRNLDHLITLQQRKLEVLKEQKKTYLKLLFSAKGQTKPALRFAGFEDEWKEVKLGEIIKSISSKNYITEYYKEGNNPVIQQGDIPIVGFSDNKPFNNFSNVILFGDHTLSLFKPETPFLLATDGIKILHSDLTTQPFLFIMLERYLPKSQGYKRHYSLLKNELSSFPTIPEQEAIGSFFQDLDKAIAKQEEKVNQLKESKQTLLRKMFI